MAEEVSADALRDGYKTYAPGTLRMYDAVVTRFSNQFVWRCPAARHLRQYQDNLSVNHLEIGPGTGWYLAHTPPPTAGAQVTLMDMNAAVLDYAGRNVTRNGYDVRTHTGNILAPIADSIGPFASAAANLVLHCVPGEGWASKGAAFGHIAGRLTDDGVFFGCTILAKGVNRNWLATRLSAAYNGKGIFHNENDDLDGLRAALESAFSEVELEVVGSVGVFSARRPRRPAQ